MIKHNKILIASYTLTLILTIIGLSSCGPDSKYDSGTKNSPPKQNNYIIVLDLSDRIIKSISQPANDTSLISYTYNQFLKSVKYHAYINSKDRFNIIPIQEGNKIDKNSFQNKLSFDMEHIALKDRKPKENYRTAQFYSNLKILYSNKGAIYSKDSSKYKGADIWKFFKDDLTDLIVDDKDFVNNIIILTDGYLFVDGKQKEINDVIPSLGKSFKKYNINLIVAEITPKENRDDEWSALENQWLMWINGMGINKVKLIKKTAIQQTKNKIEEFFKNPDKFKTAFNSNNVARTKFVPSKNNTQKKVVKQNTVAKSNTNNNAISIINFKKQLASINNNDKRFNYFMTNIYPNINKIKGQDGFNDLIQNTLSDLKYLQIKYPDILINGKKYSDYNKEIKTYEK